ncbi:MAG: V-type ATP synthase subunit F [Lachnospiraceae bacterium]|nr:V-type ATP synthase subunit F [Ruminococcus sp.]MCM1276538.1 V-type ATP synthase subunit F [Lachnospiraceae bacterium]
MKFYLISDNADTKMGMRIAGIEGVVANSAEEALSALESAAADENIAVVLMTEKLVELCHDKVYDIKLNRRRPLIVEIPDRHGNSGVIDAISRYVEDAIGIKL